MRKRILVLLSRVPYPLDKGDKLRAFYHIRELSRHHDLFVVALNDEQLHQDAMSAVKDFAKDMVVLPFSKTKAALRLVRNIFSDCPYQTAYFFSHKVEKFIDTYIQKVQPHHIYCQLIRMAPYAIKSGIDTTIDFQDAFSSGLLRRYQTAPWYFKPLLLDEYNRVKRFESETAARFNKKLIISKPDRDFFPEHLRQQIQVFPNGVDTSWFAPMDLEKRYHIIFSGNMAYPPNIDACHFLVKEIMPEIWKSKPEAKVVLAGAYPHHRVRKLAGSRVKVTGWVADMRPLYAASNIMVAPMRLGSGLQNKILEAMAMKVAVVTSPLANNAIDATDGEQILIAHDAKEFALHALSLLNNLELHNRLCYNGLEFVRQNYCWKSINAELEKLIITTPNHT